MAINLQNILAKAKERDKPEPRSKLGIDVRAIADKVREEANPLDHTPVNMGSMLSRSENPDQTSRQQLDAMAVSAATGVPVDVAKRNSGDIKLRAELNLEMGARINRAEERIKSVSTIGPFVDETAMANAQKAKSPAETLAIAKQMHDKKLITDAEFERFKANPRDLPLWAEPNPTLFQSKAKVLGGIAVAGAEDIAKGFAQGVNGTLAGTAGAVQWLAGDTLVGKGARSIADFFEENAEFIAPEDPSLVSEVAGGFGSMFTLLLPGAAVSKGLRSLQFISRGAAAFLEVGAFTVNESLVEAGSVYRERIAQTGSREDAESAARFVFFWNLPLNALTNKLGLFAGKSQALRSVITEGTQEAAQSVVSQVPTRETIDFAQVRHEALIGAIVGGGTGALMQRASRAIEEVPELSPEAQQVYNEAEQAALAADATPEAADIAGTKALGATEEGKSYIEATADAMDAVLQAEAAMGRLEEPGAILPTAELTEEEFDTLFESGATEEEIVATLIRDIEEIQPGQAEQAELQEALTGIQVARQEETTAQLIERAEKIEADAISSLTALEEGADPLPHLEALGNLVFDEGATDIETFTQTMKTKLGDLWEQFKEFVQVVFDKLKSERGSFEFGQDPIKKQIRQETGQARQGEPTISERDALKRSLQRQVTVALKARREGRQEAVAQAREQINEIRGRIGREKAKVRIERATRRTVTQFVKDTIPLSEQGKFLKAIANAHTPKQFGDIIERAQKFAEEFTESDLKKRLRSKIKKELKTTRTKKKGGKPVGKFTPEAQKTLDLLRDSAKLSTEEAEAKVVSNLAQYPDTIPPDDVALENRVLSMVHGFDNRTSAELETLLQEIKDIKNEGRMINELKKFNRQAKIERAIGESIDVVSGGKGIPASISAGEKAAKLDLDKIQGVTDRAKRWFAANPVVNNLIGWKDLLDILSRLDPSPAFQSDLSKLGDVLTTKNAEKRGIRVNIERIKQLYNDAYSLKSPREMLKRINEDSKKINLGEFTDAKGNKIQLEFTKAEARKRYMEFQDPTLEQTFTEGMAYTEDMKSAIAGILTPEDKAFAQAQLDFYVKYYDSVNNAYRDIYGVDLPQNPNYTPIRREGVARDEVTGFGEFLQEVNIRASVSSGALKSRVRNIRPISQQSDLAVLEQHMTEMEHFKAWAPRMRDLQALFGDADFRTAVKLYHSNDILGVIDNFMADFTRGGVERAGRLNWLDKLRGNLARSVLSVKASIGIKQLTSFIAYADAIPVTEFVKGTVDFWARPIENVKFMREHSELLKTRGKNMERDVKTALKSDEHAAWRATPSFLNSLMLNIQLGDQGAIMMGGWPVIKYHMDQGKSTEEAIRIFEQVIELTQQSADLSEFSTIQRGGSFAKLFTMFLSSPNQYLRKEIAALRNLSEGRISVAQAAKTISIYHLLLPMFFQWASDAFTWDEDEQLRAIILGPLNGIFIIGDILDGVIRKALGLRRFDDEVPIMSIADDAARAMDLLEPDDLDSEETLRAIRAFASLVGKLKGLPARQVIDVGEGVADILTGDFEKGATQVLGWSPFVAEKREQR